VVLGGVGQLAGTITARLASGWRTRCWSRWPARCWAKIVVLAFIILFIQRRPQGLFSLCAPGADE